MPVAYCEKEEVQCIRSGKLPSNEFPLCCGRCCVQYKNVGQEYS